MSVEIRFEPDGLSGLVAEGAYISDAARRLGVRFPTECNRKGECSSCLISIVSGAELVSSPTDVEERLLGPERFAMQYRLACLTILERTGDLVVHIHPETEKQHNEKNDPASMRKTFGDLPLNQKILMLAQLEALTMNEAMNALIDKPMAAGGKLLDKIFKPKSNQE
jgi:ferredoxin